MDRRWLPMIVLLAITCSHTSAEEGEWSRFRGPNGSGISKATTVPVRWTEQDYNWKIELPGVGESSPVVWENRIFVTCGDRETAELIGYKPAATLPQTSSKYKTAGTTPKPNESQHHIFAF